MKYEQFILDIKDTVERKVGCDFMVRLNHVIKNNALELDGLTIRNRNSKISPNFYLNDYFDRFQDGETVEDITDEILQLFLEQNNEEEQSQFDINFDFEKIKANIIFRVVNYKKNKKMLLNLPYINFLDLAITFHCLVKKEESGIGTIRISNDYMNLWKTSTNELMKIAGENTQRIFPANIRSMNEVIEGILKQDLDYYIGDKNPSDFKDFTGYSSDMTEKDMIKSMLKPEKENQQVDMYILSNSNGINGASTMLYPDVLKVFATEHNSDFYILPSSIHEVILIPYSQKMNKETLKDMVIDVNQTQVPSDEVLSNQVYIYHRSTNSIEI